ncbi:MAG: isopenicillin N synthase family oxygenase [Myxococcaceae bacterium]|nr:isopenicillin N synthase family oxygenase [Myxococcaceae bacterium]
MPIPLLSLHDHTHGTAKERARFAAAFGKGLEEFGFVSIRDHGVPDPLIRKTYALAERFFALPREAKDRTEVPGGGGQRGYTAFGKEHAKNRKVGDLKEFFHVGRELPQGHPRAASYGGNRWPTELPEFAPAALELFGALDRCAAQLLEALAESFGAPREVFSEMARDGNSILRIIHYPPLKDLFIPGAVRAAEHEDINLITLLCEGTSSGLEILTRDQQWIAVDTLKGQIVVDSGDMLSRICNEVIPSTTHRVVNPRTPAEDTVRYSMPFFVHPWPGAVLSCLPQCESKERPRKYPDITADDFLTQRLREIGLIT